MANDQPVTRKERFLAGAAGEDITLDTPITREERFLAKAAGMDVKTDDPVTRSEKYLAKIAEGGGGGSVPEYTGSYTVTPSEQTQTLATDGKECVDDITVNPIPSSYVQPSGTKSITENGTSIDVKNYQYVDVAVSGGGASVSSLVGYTWVLNKTMTFPNRPKTYELPFTVGYNDDGLIECNKLIVNTHSVTGEKSDDGSQVTIYDEGEFWEPDLNFFVFDENNSTLLTWFKANARILVQAT